MKDKIFNNINTEVKKKAKKRDIYKIVFTTEDDKDIEYEIIATFRNKAKKKIYYLLTDNTRDNKKLNMYAYYINYDENKDELSEVNETFYPVDDETELKTILDAFDKIQSKL